MADTQKTNNQVDVYTGTIDTAPDRYRAALTGTVSTTGKVVVGVGTKFLSECSMWEWLLIGSQVRKIESIADDTTLYLANAFSSNIGAGATAYVVPISQWNQLGIVDISGSPVINGIVTYSANEHAGWGSMQDSAYIVDPVVIDTTGGGSVHIVKFSKGSN